MTRKSSMSYKLGGYEADITIELFEECGYVKYENLDKFFEDCYFDFETRFTKEKFIKVSKDNLMKHPKYVEFLNNEVKMCGKCYNFKPLSSFTNSKQSSDGKFYYCKCCKNEYQREQYASNERVRKIHDTASQKYAKNNPDKVRELKKRWYQENKTTKRQTDRRFLMKNNLKKLGCDKNFTRDELNKLVGLKDGHNIKTYKEFFERFKGVING